MKIMISFVPFMKAKMFFVVLIFSIGCLVIIDPVPTHGQEKGFPSKEIEVIVPFGAGGAIDIGSRIFAEPLSRELKTPVIIKNQAGGGSLVGATAFYNAKPDGYTILAASGAILSSPQFSDNPPSFDVRKDFLPIAYIGIQPVSVIVRKDSPFKTFQDLVQYAQKNPGKLQGGCAGLGGETHIMFMTLLKDAKIESKLIPYKDQAGISMALLGGHIDWKTATLVANMQYIRSGEMRSLLLTSRHPEFPNIPSGPDIGLPRVSTNIWVGFFAHSKTPKPVYDRLVSAMKVAFNDSAMKDSLTKAGWLVSYKDPQEFSKFINSQWILLGNVIKETGMTNK
jgi:tripartite-type tricarboxylate transporter receptor subunit TctC